VIERTGVLPNQPLFYVLASLRFQRWLSLPSKIADIQDALRERFPLINQVYFADPTQGAAPPKPTTEPAAWAFHTADRSLGCQITHEQIVVHTTRYNRFSDFAEVFKFVLEAAEPHVKHFDVGAIGIRYLDRISPREGESLSDYLPAQYLPKPLSEVGFSVESGLSQTVYRTRTGVLQARFWAGQQYVSVPDDLVPIFVMTQELEPAGPVLPPLAQGDGILDSDSIWSSLTPVRIGVDEAVAKLNALHVHSNEFFRTICTEKAFAAWRGEA
jgi:uncharacterized protein (TIGR04255 family)